MASPTALKALAEILARTLSPENRELVAGILDGISAEGGITSQNRQEIENLLFQLAARNDVDLAQLRRPGR